VDALRPRDEERYYPGETNLRMADMVLITKVNMLPDIQQAHDYAEHLKTIVKPNTPIIYGESVIVPEAKNPQTGEPLSTEEAAALVRGKRVLVIDDGPTLTHGGMSFGAGYAMAQELGAAEIVDPRPYAEGSLAATFEKFKHLHNVLPAMGYGEEQMRDLEATIRATPCDTIVLGTPSDMTHLMELDKPSVIARYNLKIVPEHAEQFDEVLRSYFDRFHAHHQQPPKAA
jgi:predicted GTPase